MDASVDRPAVVDTGNTVDTPAVDVQTPADTGEQLDAGTTPDSGTTPSCPTNPTMVTVTGEITADTTWTCEHTYQLSGGPVFVRAPAVLTIGAGTRITGEGSTSSLISTRGARVEANGTRERPIVFTSSKAVGQRTSGDWGGVVLLGRATINSSVFREGSNVITLPTGENQIEGIDSADMRARYGGASAPDDAWNCGTLKYVRIEFAGFALSANNELNGLTMGGCGTGTTIDYVQVHRGADDGIEIFGGTVGVKHAVSSMSDDDGFDWDLGYRGKVQFLVIQSPPNSGETDPTGIEADNDRDNNASTPRSAPTMSNVTIAGPGSGVSVANNRAMVLRRGTAGVFHNFVITGFPTGGIDVRDTATFAQANMTPALLDFQRSVIFDSGPGGNMPFTDAETTADNFDESAFFMTASRSNRVVAAGLTDPTNVTAPNFRPAATSAAATGGQAPSDAFFEAATFVGALSPEASQDWTQGWTSFPAN